MLRSIDKLIGYVLQAHDGEIGRCKDFLFDDERWGIRYMVADTGKWLPGRRVLVSPISLGHPEWDEERLPVALTKEQIESAPGIPVDAPVSGQHEAEYFAFMGYLPYWGGVNPWGPYMTPTRLRAAAEGAGEGVATSIEHREDSHLRSAHEVTGYHIRASDGDVGHVEDFIVDDDNWIIRYMVVDTRNWLPGRKVIIAPEWVRGFDWAERTATVDLTKDQIENSPDYTPDAPLSRSYEERLYDYYERPTYWP